MISTICKAILDKLNTSGINTDQIELRSLVNRTLPLKGPAVNVAADSATMEPITMTTYKVTLDISLVLVLKDISSGGEEKGRLEAQDIIDAMIQAFTLTDLGLELQDPLVPSSFRNVTDKEYGSAGYLVYQLILRCAYNITKESTEEDWGILTSILTKYYHEPRGYTGMLGVTGPELAGLIHYEGGSTGIDG